MVREYPALVTTDARDLSENSGNPAFAHPNLCPAPVLCRSVALVNLTYTRIMGF